MFNNAFKEIEVKNCIPDKSLYILKNIHSYAIIYNEDGLVLYLGNYDKLYPKCLKECKLERLKLGYRFTTPDGMVAYTHNIDDMASQYMDEYELGLIK
ncbi:MAG: hypothetical protein ACRCXT_09800 [Paraclostridium sp.]